MWVARNSDDSLRLFPYKPSKGDDVWVGLTFDEIELDDFEFQFSDVTWEDEEPTEVELILKRVPTTKATQTL